MRRVAILALAMAAITAPALAHHSFAMFDQSKKLVLKGKVKEFQWTNPHAFLEVEVPGARGAAPVSWSIELNSPNNLRRQGWTRTSVKPGDIISVTVNPLRNGKPGALFNSLVLADGRTLSERAFDGGRAVNVPGAPE